jgi:hypothetical protein
LEQAGLVISGLSPDGRLVEIIELRDHPWFVASQFHPELKSRPTNPHPLFRDFVGAALRQHEARAEATAGPLGLRAPASAANGRNGHTPEPAAVVAEAAAG